MKIRETSSGYKITEVLSGRSNVFLLSYNEKNILIDTSPGFMWNILQKRLKKLGVKHIDYLILTHTHFDHAANSRRIKEKYGSRVIVHSSEGSYLTTGENFVPEGTNPFSRTIIKLFAKLFLSIARYEPCQYDITSDDIFDLKDLGFNARIIHTPGHTKGSISIIIDDEVALVGDTMFGVFSRSIFPPFASDPKELISSWGKLLKTNCYVFMPSHGSENSRSLVEIEYRKRDLFKSEQI